MAKRKRLKARRAKESPAPVALSQGDKAQLFNVMANASLMRSTLLNKLIDPRRDIDDECGYPKELTTEQYKLMYDREAVATRVVSVYSEESWVVDPMVQENEEPEETDFEEAWRELEAERNLYSYMMKADELSGIGRFGIMLLGYDDGLSLDKPVTGLDDRGEPTGNAENELLFVRVFSEAEVTVKALEKDMRNPRYGKPTMYSVSFETVSKTRDANIGELKTKISQEQQVHWTRVIHVADNRKSSEVFGVPRMQTLFNRLYDIRKIAGGSGEMFWKGGFPGYAFEMDANARPLTTTQKETLTEEIAAYANGLQRYLTLQGIEAKSLNPQMGDPKDHVETQLELIAIGLGIPKRVFMGAEQAKLASSQDAISWNKRVSRRQNKYLSPYLIRPLIDRLVATGVLPEPEEYKVVWPDLDAPSDKDKAEVLRTEVEAFSKYVAGGVDALIPEEIFLKMFAGLTSEQVEEIKAAVLQRERDLMEEEPEEDEDEPPAPPEPEDEGEEEEEEEEE